MFSHKKKVLALAGAIANLSLSCAVAGAATFAWFAYNNTVNANGMRISSVDGKEININSYRILKYDDDLKAGVSYYNDPNAFVLPDYDQYIKSRNVYSNIVIRMDLSFPKGLDTTHKSVEIDIYKLATSTLKDANGIRLLTSNVAQFQCIATQYTTENSDTPVSIPVGISETQGSYKSVDDAMYRTAIAYFAARKTPTTFISLMNDQPVDPDRGNIITLVPELYNVGTIKHSIIYIECSYNEKLVDGFVEDHPDESIHNLEGDITDISFVVRDFTGRSFGQNSTGQYIRMNDVGGSYNGQYLSSYVGDSNKRVMDGSLTTGEETVAESSGINSSNNLISVNDYIRSDSSKMYASKTIDAASLTYDRKNGTFKSDNNHYVGNDTTTDGIVSSESPTGLDNILSYTGYDAGVNSIAHNSMKMQYDSSDGKIAYYGTNKSPISLYRYHENNIINATLTGFNVTGPTGDNATTSVGAYFSLKGVSCVATYTKPDNTTFTLNVASFCTFTSTGEGTLIPEKTMFTTLGSPKVITITYSDRGVTKTGSYNLTVVADILQYIEISSMPNKTTFVKGEPFDITGLVVNGHFETVGEVDVTSDCVFKINGTTYVKNQILDISGTNITVAVHYNGGATTGEFYQDKTFKITINNFVIDIESTNEVIGIGDSLTISFTFNGNVDWTITGKAGSLSFSSSDATATTNSTTYTGSDFANQSSSIIVYGLAAGTSTVTATINGTTIKDTCIVRVSDGSELTATYTVTSTSTVSTTGDTPSGSTASYSSTYGTKCQLTAGNHMTLTLSGYSNYKITGITLSMKSNAGGGAGSFEASVGNTSISSIANATFNDPTWNSQYTTSYVDITPTITTEKTVGRNETVELTISATTNSLYCQSFTITYEPGELASVQSLQIKDGETVLNSGTKTISSGNIGMTWTPTALVTYVDESTDNAVTWSIVSGSNLTINANTGVITLNSASGTAVIKATTRGMNSQGQQVEASFTLNWSGLTKILSSITLDTTGVTNEFEINDAFTYEGLVVTAHYTDNTTATISVASQGNPGGYTVSSPDMTTAGTKEVTVTYTEGNVTKTATYNITVVDDTPHVYTDTYGLNGKTLYFASPEEGGVYYMHSNGKNTSSPPTATTNTAEATPYTFTLVGDDTFEIKDPNGYYLYCTNTNNGVRVGETQDSFVISAGTKMKDGVLAAGSYDIKDTNYNRYLCVYNNQDWRCYDSPSAGNRNVNTDLYESLPTLSSIAISGNMTTKTYELGDNFDPAGLTVTGTYTNGQTVDLTSSATFTFTPATANSTSLNSVSVVATAGGLTSAAHTETGITVTNPTPSVSLNKSTATLAVSGTDTLTATVQNGTGTAADVTWSTSDSSKVSISTTSGGSITITGLAAGEATITATYEGATATCVVTVTAPAGGSETIDFTAQGFSNNQAITTVNGTNFDVTFDKGNNSNAPKYYTSGTAIRAYGGNTFTVASSQIMTKIEITFGSSDGSNTITTDVGTYSNGTWQGSATSVTFTIGGSSGNRRLQAIKVTFASRSIHNTINKPIIRNGLVTCSSGTIIASNTHLSKCLTTDLYKDHQMMTSIELQQCKKGERYEIAKTKVFKK